MWAAFAHVGLLTTDLVGAGRAELSGRWEACRSRHTAVRDACVGCLLVAYMPLAPVGLSKPVLPFERGVACNANSGCASVISEPDLSVAPSESAQRGLERIDYRWEQQKHGGRAEALHAVAASLDRA